jgi:hypothetical protein
MPGEVIDRVHALARRNHAQRHLLFGDRQGLTTVNAVDDAVEHDSDDEPYVPDHDYNYDDDDDLIAVYPDALPPEVDNIPTFPSQEWKRTTLSQNRSPNQNWNHIKNRNQNQNREPHQEPEPEFENNIEPDERDEADIPGVGEVDMPGVGEDDIPGVEMGGEMPNGEEEMTSTGREVEPMT